MLNSCSITGHRPKHFDFGYDEEHPACTKLKRMVAGQIEMMIQKHGVNKFYTGMAQGVDIWAAEIILDLKKNEPGLQLIAVVPYEGQADRWDNAYRERYSYILSQCDDVITLNKTYKPDCMFERNRTLVDRALFLLAIHNGSARTGTGFTVQYAREQSRYIYTIHADGSDVTTPADVKALERRHRFKINKNENSE